MAKENFIFSFYFAPKGGIPWKARLSGWREDSVLCPTEEFASLVKSEDAGTLRAVQAESKGLSFC